MPTGLPTHVAEEDAERDRRGERVARGSRRRARSRRSRARTAARSRSSSTGGAGCCSRSFGEIAARSPAPTERASSGVGCSRNSRKRSVARSRSARPAGYAYVDQPDREPDDDRLDARLEQRDPDRGRERAADEAAPRVRSARASEHARRRADRAEQPARRRRPRVYTVAITTSASDVVDDRRRVSMNARSRSGNRGPTSASIPSANAVSVDIATPQPCADGRPALKAR